MTAQAQNKNSHSAVQRPNRREFLYYMGGASVAVLAAGLGVGLSRFLNPTIYGQGTGLFKLNSKDIPRIDDLPHYLPDGLCWLVILGGRLTAYDAHCPLEGTLIRWVDSYRQFACPACGSWFTHSGEWIWGSARRGLDIFTIQVWIDGHVHSTPPDGSAIAFQDASQIVIDTGHKIWGKSR
ncbi:MAG: hypothetical protein R3E39_09245 [Anaerolineae bacterium]